MAYLIEHDGERQFVSSLDGYEGCTVIAEGNDAEPKEHHDWNEQSKKWVVNPGRKAKAERDSVLRGMNREDLIAYIEADHAQFDARLQVIEGVLGIAAASGRVSLMEMNPLGVPAIDGGGSGEV